ncbi:transglycosylase SLT domain-containing protein [Novosphingobium sp. FSY-8]|uniref:Transglycosylase SLT domain-containing protein n=1 Tax=Novosphingobium ovatum TaxID=1908523 RepID=A0ABW9XG39_9SPHN|nr:transglycosylase SLT domain-containing protein [Novosphingobium ovatum]
MRGTVARAAQTQGVDFSYLLAQARLESGFNPQARAATSSATGLFQFTDSTWLGMLRRHGADMGLIDGASAGAGGMMAALADPAARARLMALRQDPQVSAMMAARLASDNKELMTARLGRAPDSAELYLAHFLGTEGAIKFLAAMSSDPSQSAAALMPAAAAANRSIFYNADGGARSLSEVMGLMRQKITGAMAAEGQADPTLTSDGLPLPGAYLAGAASLSGPMTSAPAPDPNAHLGPIARQFAAASGQHLAVAGNGGGDTTAALSDSFARMAEATGATTPDYVRAAYGRLRAMGL